MGIPKGKKFWREASGKSVLLLISLDIKFLGEKEERKKGIFVEKWDL